MCGEGERVWGGGGEVGGVWCVGGIEERESKEGQWTWKQSPCQLKYLNYDAIAV